MSTWLSSRFDIEDAFSKIGRVRDVWVARKVAAAALGIILPPLCPQPPGFAFIEMEDKRDAEDAVKDLDGTRICGNRVKVSGDSCWTWSLWSFSRWNCLVEGGLEGAGEEGEEVVGTGAGAVQEAGGEGAGAGAGEDGAGVGVAAGEEEGEAGAGAEEGGRPGGAPRTGDHANARFLN